jgi:hypothetical protein
MYDGANGDIADTLYKGAEINSSSNVFVRQK